MQALDPYLRDKRLSDINMDVLWSFIRDRRERDGVKNSTINRALEIVRRILNLAHQDWGWLQRVPRVRMLKVPKGRIRFLTHEEADRLNEALPEHLRPVVRYALASGCRMSEILHLEWSRVDFGRRVAWLDPGTTKNGEGRGIPLNKDAVLALRPSTGSMLGGALRTRASRWGPWAQHGNARCGEPGSRSSGSTICGTPGRVGM